MIYNKTKDKIRRYGVFLYPTEEPAKSIIFPQQLRLITPITQIPTIAE